MVFYFYFSVLFSFSLFPGPPDAPEDPDLLSKTKDSVTLSWFTPLHDGGSSILGYRVEMRQVDSALWLPCHSEPVCNTEFTVGNLISGIGYCFRVAAINRAGIGEPIQLPQTVQLGEMNTDSWTQIRHTSEKKHINFFLYCWTLNKLLSILGQDIEYDPFYIY